MVGIEAFAVEQWMDEYETTPNVVNVAETCCASVSIQDLFDLEGSEATPSSLSLTSTKLTYGPIRGSETLRRRIGALHRIGDAAAPLAGENVLVTNGAIAANFLVLYTLVGPGDHVVCVYPTYQQLYSVPTSLGAEVSLWKLKEEDGYVPNLRDLDALVRENTKMIIINNPNNPTGAVTPRSSLEAIVDFARKRGIIVLSDEVYRPLFHSLPDGEAAPPSILELGYEKTIATGSMSKAFSLAGIRVGWIASGDKGIIESLASARDYTTISVSQLDDQVASLALSDAVRPALMRRNLALAWTNAALLEAFVGRHRSVCSWVRPRAGTTAFIHFTKKSHGGEPVDEEKLCLDVLKATNVMLVPGARCFGRDKDFRGFVRFGYVCETDVLKTGLERLDDYIAKNLV